MEDFVFAGKTYKSVEVKQSRCGGCSFEHCPISICYKLPDCNNSTVPYIFVETSQNALQQEQKTSS